MFVASYQNTMRNAKFVRREPEPPVRTIEEIRAEKRREAAEAARQWHEEMIRRRQRQIEREAIRAAETIAKGRAAARAFNETNQDARIFAQICKRMCTVFDVSMVDVKSDRRGRHVALCRQAIMYWTVRLTGYSYPQIGRFLGNRDHTTCMYGAHTYVEKRASAGRKLRAAR